MKDPTPRRKTQGRLFFGWYIVAACVALNFYLSISFFQGFQAFFLPILTEFGWSRTLMSGAFSLRQLESGLLAPVVGILVDRWGPRKVILGGVVVAGAGMVFLGLVTSIWMFYVAFIVISVGTSGASHGISWPAIIVYWFERRRGIAMGTALLGPVLSGPFVVLVVLLEEAIGWRLSLISLGLGLWLVGVPLGLIARPRPEPYGYLPDGQPRDHSAAVASSSELDSAAVSSSDREGPHSSTASEAWRASGFWILVITFAVHGLGVSGFMVHQLPLFQSIGFSAREGAIILGLIFFLSGIGRMSVGWLMDIFDPRQVLAGVLLIQSASYVGLIALAPSWWQVLVFALIFGAAFGSTIPARLILVRELFGGRAFGSINGLIQGMSFGAGLIGPILMGAVYDLRGTYTPALLAFAVLTALIAPLPLRLSATIGHRARMPD